MTILMKRLGAIWVARQLAKAILKPLVIWAHRLGRLLAPAAATIGRACVNAKAKYDANPKGIILIPFVAAFVGWFTNWLAVKMIFRPVKPRRLLFFKLHGLMARRQADLAKAIGRVVGEHLVEHKDVVKSLNKLDFGGILGKVLDRGLAPKIQELRSLPLIGGFLTEERIADIKQSITDSIMEHREEVLDVDAVAMRRGSASWQWR